MKVKSISSSISKIIKSIRNMNLSAFTKISLTILLGYLINLLTSWNKIVEAFTSLKSNFLKRDKDIRLILAPRSHNVLYTCLLPIL